MDDYIKYLQEVLGIKNIIIETTHSEKDEGYFFTQSGPVSKHEVKHCELVFLNILTQSKESLFNPATQELFQKMKIAMKVNNVQYLELDCTLSNRSELPSEVSKICESKFVVVFSSFPQNLGEFKIVGSGKWLETYSPAYLLEDVAAKKVVWNDLQKVMRELNL